MPENNLYLGLSDKDINFLIAFAVEGDLWGYYGGDDTDIDASIERIYAAHKVAYPDAQEGEEDA